MLLKSLKLSHIRSYTNQEIVFPEGSILLSGDIGSGKSTILLAIEFSLFGSKSSELPASSLLRHGSKEGFVELRFQIEKKDITIKRILKKTKMGIKQDTGYIIINEVKQELSPVEMKATIFELLGYPRDLVSKGKDLIYRYTVYTPQEEMKRILLEDKDSRLNTLRKVFNIDKYRKIKENTVSFVRNIKEKKKEHEGFISDIFEKKKEHERTSEEFENVEKELKEKIPNLKKLSEEVKEKKDSLKLFEDKITELNGLKNSLNVNETNLNNLLKDRGRNKASIESLEKQISDSKKELVGKEIADSKEIKEQLAQAEGQRRDCEEKISGIRTKITELEVSKRRSNEIIEKVSKIENCPLCLQEVSHEHKTVISEKEKKIIDESIIKLEQFMKEDDLARKNLLELEKKIDELKKQEGQTDLLKLKIKNAKEKKLEKEKLESSQDSIKKDIGKINMEKMSLNKKIEEMKDIEIRYKEAKSDLEGVQEEEKRLFAEKTGIEKQKESLIRIVNSLKEEIAKKDASKRLLENLSIMQGWLESYFIKLMGTMEKHIMVHVHREFNELFKEWFSMLMEDETLSVRLDDEFTPVISQNGYETNLENLSGGEKTSVALSYRLSLNKVINDVVSGIRTKDLLVLDEPTDGFSSEQLDKIRDILEQLKMKQVLIVSHESKIESFVDNVKRIEKREHVSCVI